MSAVSVNTYSYSVTYVTNQMLNSLKRIILWIGLDPAKFLDNWASTERAMEIWLRAHELETVVLEIYNPQSDKLVGRWDFTIDYSYGAGDDGEMWADTDAIKYAIAKCGVTASSCKYRVLLQCCTGHTQVSGWSTATYRSTAGFVKQSIGTTIGTDAIGASANYWRKS